MSPSERFRPVRQVVEKRELGAAKELGEAQRSQQDEEAKLEQLQQFQREYQQRFTAAARNGMEVQRLLEYQGFMAKLEKAVQEQVARVAASRRDSVQKRVNWQQKHNRTQAIGKVMEHYKQAEDAAEQRTEQKASDEYGLRGRKKT
jgi:flagellar FliJ protein